MEITDVRVRKVEFETGKTKAFASVTFDDVFVVHDLRVVEGDKGLFVTMPRKKLPSGEFRDIAHPLNNEFRELIQRTVLEKYHQEP